MSALAEDRRRSPRMVVHQHQVSVLTTRNVRVLDISAGGVRLAGLSPIPIMTGTVWVALPGGSIRGQIHVRHERRLPDGSVQLGAAFIEMDKESRRRLAQFLKKSRAIVKRQLKV